MHTQYETQTIDFSLLMCVCVRMRGGVRVRVCVHVQMVFCEYVYVLV